LLIKIIQLIAGFFHFIFKLLFYKEILAKIYYQTFRLKKTYFSENTPFQLIRDKTVYFFLFGLALLIIISNLLSINRAGAMEVKIPQTVMANLIHDEFSNYAEDELIEETSTLSETLLAGKEKYLDDSCSLEKQDQAVLNPHLEENNFLAFNEESDSLLKPQIIDTDELSGGFVPQRTEIVNYAVQTGDTVSTIAQKFNITVNTILWANNLSAFSLIRPGDNLVILPYSGVLHTIRSGETLSKIAKQYGVEEDKILSCNNLGNTLKIGEKIIVPGGRKITTTAAAPKSTSYTGVAAIKDLVKSPNSSASGNKMLWPTVGRRITQYFSWRHTGLDIANKVGTPLYAADAGVVEFAGWNSNGYGYNVVINHGGGKKTRYAHASKLFVKAGDEVEKGENIAAMGSTGRSTGSHLHFEIIINGSRYNPLNYVK